MLSPLARGALFCLTAIALYVAFGFTVQSAFEMWNASQAR